MHALAPSVWKFAAQVVHTFAEVHELQPVPQFLHSLGVVSSCTYFAPEQSLSAIQRFEVVLSRTGVAVLHVVHAVSELQVSQDEGQFSHRVAPAFKYLLAAQYAFVTHLPVAEDAGYVPSHT